MIETRDVVGHGGVACAVRSAGANGPALVFVHGVGSTAAIWDAQLRAFDDAYRCFAIELRGNGIPRPEPSPSEITRAGYAADVFAVLDAYAIESYTIIGCSLGGVVAFELWQRDPSRIDAMAIVGSFARYPNARSYADGIAAALRAAGSMENFARSRAEKLGLPPERLRETIEQMACKAVSSYLAATEATWTGDYLDLLPGINVPALIACGEHDAIAPLALSEEIAAGIPASELSVIAGAGHVANADAPARFNERLQTFLTRHLRS